MSRPRAPTPAPERPQAAVLVASYADSRCRADAERSLAELGALLETAGGRTAEAFLFHAPHPRPDTLIGSGQVQKVKEALDARRARSDPTEGAVDLVVVNRELSPSQFRNLEKAWDARVLDRSGLILDIFAQRARSREGRLQVELAQLQYLLPRLRGRGTAMSRLGGGIGTRGPGETQLEVDQRRIRDRLARLRGALDQVRRSRAVQRKRRSGALPRLALVGYTNSGKSTLLNRLARSEVYAADQLFATLDPTVRRARLPGGGRVLLGDTVGFIRDLPHPLVEAFRATLEEAAQADGLLIVVDVSDPDHPAQIATVFEVLREIGLADTPRLFAFNKADRWNERLGDRPALINAHGPSAFVSALTGEGIPDLQAHIEAHFLPPRRPVRLFIDDAHGPWLGTLQREARVWAQEAAEGGVWLEASLSEDQLRRLARDGIRP